jgi:hypothetical protein
MKRPRPSASIQVAMINDPAPGRSTRGSPSRSNSDGETGCSIVITVVAPSGTVETKGRAPRAHDRAQFSQRDCSVSPALAALPAGTYRLTEHNCARLAIAQRLKSGHVCSYRITPR